MTTVGDHANTPEWILDRVRGVDHIALDPCSNPTSIVSAAQSIQLPGDGLLVNWIDYCRGNGLAFVNPPYSRGSLIKWASKCDAEARRGCQIVALVPCDPSTKWFDAFAESADLCVALFGRVKFGGHDQHSNGPHAVFYWGERTTRFIAMFGDAGRCVSCGTGATRERLCELRESALGKYIEAPEAAE